MTPEQWARVKEVFGAALEQEPDKRRAFVATAAAGDHAVRAEVERLLDAERQSADFMERPAGATLVSGRVLGHYEIGRLSAAAAWATCSRRATSSSAARSR